MIADDIIAVMSSNAGTPTERAIAVLIAAGVTSSETIAKALGLTMRAVQLARKKTALRTIQGSESEVGFAKQTSPAKQVSPPNEVRFATTSTDSRARAYKESPSEITTSLCEREREAGATAEAKATPKILIDATGIYGPKFALDFAAIDTVAALIPFDKTKARQIAEVCARDWFANGTVPQQPMAMVKAAILSQHRGDEVHRVRLARAATPASSFGRPPVSGRREVAAIVGGTP